jgi:hypothetical protein
MATSFSGGGSRSYYMRLFSCIDKLLDIVDNLGYYASTLHAKQHLYVLGKVSLFIIRCKDAIQAGKLEDIDVSVN